MNKKKIFFKKETSIALFHRIHELNLVCVFTLSTTKALNDKKLICSYLIGTLKIIKNYII